MSRVAQFALIGLVLGGVLLILILPQPHLTGSYQATHGPTVTLRSLRSLPLLMLAIAASAGSVAGRVRIDRESARHSRGAGLASVLLC